MSRFLLAAGLLASQGFAQVVINEFQYDDAGTDDFEFVELYNAGPPIDISGWTIVNRDSASPVYGGAGIDPTHVIPPATILLTGGYYVLGNALVPNVNLVLASGMLENDNESIELYDAANVLQDSVCYEMGLGAFGTPPLAHPLEGKGFYGDLATGNLTSSIGRIFDGYDTNQNSVDFVCSALPTPGGSNNETGAVAYSETFDGGSLLGIIPGWNRGFVFPRYVDPTTVDAQNRTTKPASPQGGLAMSIWDNTGGGNAIQFASAPASDVVVECYAWIEPLMSPVNPSVGPPYNTTTIAVQPGNYNWADGETWSIGCRGTIGANANPANVNGTYYNDIGLGVGLRPHQASGIAWVYYRTRSYAQLWLVDLKDGASAANPTNFTVIGGPINITAGVNDGWQRLRLHVQGNVVVGNFGGTYGYDDGVRFAGTTTTTQLGKVYVGYREAVLYDQNGGGTAGCHPPLFDAFDIHLPTTSKSFYGAGSPLANAVVPGIDADGLAILGSTGFGIKGNNLFPSGFSYLAIGLNFFPVGFQIPSAPPGANAYLFPLDFEFFLFPDAFGNVTQTIPLPQDPNLNGIPFVAQIASFDPGLLAYALPIGVTQPMQMTLGR